MVDSGLEPDAPALLLEGSWPAAAPPQARWALDSSIDARFGWIDRQAAEWAQRLAQDGLMLPRGNSLAGISSADLNALELRYYLVKLLRVVAFFSEVRPLRPPQTVALAALRHRDRDYAEVLEQVCRLGGVDCQVRWIDEQPAGDGRFPHNGLLRRLAHGLVRRFEPRAPGRGGRPRIVLCGNPGLLDPVCGELVARGAQVWWLYDRFALKSFLRWRSAGVRQLACDASLGQQNRFFQHLPERLDCRGVDLAPTVSGWLAERLSTHGPRQTRLVEQLDAHFRRIAPDALVLDEDATPLGRAAVAVGRVHGAASAVVQHGAPCCRFGFAPLAADRILVWGRSSGEQLSRWGVSPQQIRIVGSPRHDQLRARLADRRGQKSAGHEQRPPHFLLLTTMPPRDDRPDAVTLRLTTQTYAEMLRTAIACVARRPGAWLSIKLHPRAAADPILDRVLAEGPRPRTRIIRHVPMEEALDGVDCVLSCGSSAGVDATLSAIPVIQILPPGTSDFLPCEQWGLAGTAHDAAELESLLDHIRTGRRAAAAGPDPDVFGDFQRPAAERIGDEVLALTQRDSQASPSLRRVA
jgi:hypothetical protein